MKFFDKLYARYDALCDKVEKLDLNPVKRAAVPLFSSFLRSRRFCMPSARTISFS